MVKAAAVRTAFHVVERLRSRSTSRGLGSGSLDVLIRLSTAPEDGMSLGAPAGRVGRVGARNATGLVDALERDGLVARVPDRNDRRSVPAGASPKPPRSTTCTRPRRSAPSAPPSTSASPAAGSPPSG